MTCNRQCILDVYSLQVVSFIDFPVPSFPTLGRQVFQTKYKTFPIFDRHISKARLYKGSKPWIFGGYSLAPLQQSSFQPLNPYIPISHTQIWWACSFYCFSRADNQNYFRVNPDVPPSPLLWLILFLQSAPSSHSLNLGPVPLATSQLLILTNTYCNSIKYVNVRKIPRIFFFCEEF
jgi:hypothetical protein